VQFAHCIASSPPLLSRWITPVLQLRASVSPFLYFLDDRNFYFKTKFVSLPFFPPPPSACSGCPHFSPSIESRLKKICKVIARDFVINLLIIALKLVFSWIPLLALSVVPTPPSFDVFFSQDFDLPVSQAFSLVLKLRLHSVFVPLFLLLLPTLSYQDRTPLTLSSPQVCLFSLSRRMGAASSLGPRYFLQAFPHHADSFSSRLLMASPIFKSPNFRFFPFIFSVATLL